MQEYKSDNPRSRSDSRSAPVVSRTGELPTAYKNTKAKILALALIFSLNLWPPVRASYLLLVKIKEREPALFTLILAYALALILALTPCSPVRASYLLLMLCI